MKLGKRAPRSAVLTALAVALALCVTACGSSSSSSGSSKTARTSHTATTTAKASFAAYTACLKSHGVTTATRKGGFGGGFGHVGTSTTGAPPTGAGATGTRPTGTRPTGTHPTGTTTTGGYPGGAGGPGFAGASSKDAKAAKACASKLPKGAKDGFGKGRFRGERGGSTAAGGSAFTTKELDAYVSCIRKNGYAAMPDPSTKGGAVFPKSVASNTKFKAANEKCQSLLVAAGAGGASPSGSEAK